MSLVRQVDDGKANAKNNKKDTIARGLRVFDVMQKDSEKSHIKDDDMEAAKQFILDVLKTRTKASETKPQINEAREESKNKTISKKVSIDQEMKELLAQPIPERSQRRSEPA